MRASWQATTSRSTAATFQSATENGCSNESIAIESIGEW
jgi:hypothetical protein